MAAKVQLIGGAFQDNEGNLLVSGYLMLKLSQDESITGIGQICSGIETKITLNASGSVDTTSPQSVWGNDQMLPVNSYYRVTGYKATGQLAWGPNNQQVNGSGGTFDVGTWLPNTVISWTPSPQSLLLQTNEVNNGSQATLDLHAGANITLADNGVGRVTITSASGSSTGPRPSVANWHYWNGLQIGTQFTVGTGMSLQQTGPAGTGFAHTTVAATATEPTYNSFTSNAVAAAMGWFDNSNATTTNNSAGITTGLLTDWQSRVLTPITTSVRYWIGMSDGLIAQGGGNFAYLQSDAPTSNPMLAFRYSTNAGDTKWKCIAQTDGTHQTIVDSGISIDAAASHIFEIKVSAGVATYFIDSVQVGSISTNLPATNRLLSQCVWQDNLGGSVALSFGVGWLYWESSK